MDCRVPKSARKKGRGDVDAIFCASRGGRVVGGRYYWRPGAAGYAERGFGRCVKGRGYCLAAAREETWRPSEEDLRKLTGGSGSGDALDLGEGGRLRGQGEDGPNFLHAGDGFRAGAKAQAQLAAEAAHPPRQMHQQQPILLKAGGPFFRREAQPLDGAG